MASQAKAKQAPRRGQISLGRARDGDPSDALCPFSLAVARQETKIYSFGGTTGSRKGMEVSGRARDGDERGGPCRPR